MSISRYRALARGLGFKRRIAINVLLLNLTSTVFESIGLAMLLPVFQFVRTGGDLAALTADSGAWRWLVRIYDSVGLPLDLPILLATTFLSVLARQLFVYLRAVYIARKKQGLIITVRNRGFNDYLYASIRYQDRETLGDVVNDLTTDLERAVGALFGVVMLACYAVVGTFYVGLILALSVEMTLAALTVTGLAALTLGRVFKETQRIGRQVAAANQGMSRFLVERLRAARLVRLSRTEPAETAAMRVLTGRQRDTLVRLAMLSARIEVVVEPLVVGLGFAFLYVGVTSFGLSLEEIGLFLVILLRLLPVVKQGLRERQSVLGKAGSLEAVSRRLRTLKEAAEVDSGAQPFEGLETAVKLKDVHFDYDRGAQVPALAGVSIDIPAHRMTARVGPSGGGKSTLVDMLPRLRGPDTGRILIDDTGIEEFELSSLRAGIAYVPQEAQIFDVSATEHIGYGMLGASLDEVREAARLAGADGFLSALPEGYDTPLGENGQRLSGGQRQRLDLARGLVGRTPILILDEPTSNLDADSETAFREALSRIRREMDVTIVIIGHRLSTVADADQIVVLEDGRVIESGTHAALVARGGWYARAWAQQQRSEPDAAPIEDRAAIA